jgi:hypothetical protein
MSNLEHVRVLCEGIAEKIREEMKAETVNKSKQLRIRNEMNQLKKLITFAKAESVELCKK